ncbi:protein Dok-7-like isoform X2 [Stigmatopora nigra]
MTDSVVVEGYARLKDGKKWKTRWVVFRKPSPVADCLLLLVFKDKADKSEEEELARVTLEEICGLESGGRWGEGAAPFALALVCLSQTAVLAFHSEETLAAWELRLRHCLGEVHRFNVGVLAGTKLEKGPATLHLCNNLLALTRDTPPVVVGHWNLPDLRRYGPVADGFVFEGGTRCGFWAGVFLLASPEGEQISFLFDCIVRGVSPTRGPRGLLPVPPDVATHRSSLEERLNQETRELEKRLSVLSNRNSAAPPGDDDRSLSGSSENSDVGVLNRLTVWTPSDGKEEKALADRGAGAQPSGVEDPGRLLGSGRRSSLDSGMATGSHSSSSGSFSSCTESLDASVGPDFGPVFSLTPPHLARELRPCGCPIVGGLEYKVPTQLRYLYDTPRTLVRDHATLAKDSDDDDDPVTESLKGSSGGLLQTWARSQIGKMGATPSADNPEWGTTKSILTVCSLCGGLQGVPFHPASGATIPALPDKRPNGREGRGQADPAYEVMEGRVPEPNSERPSWRSQYVFWQGGDKSKYELMLGCEGGVGAFPWERPAINYVNIPVSPTSKKELNYMEVELRDSAGRGLASGQNKGKESTKYAQIDITATETAHKVGTQHALGRQEGLHTLERRKKGTPH